MKASGCTSGRQTLRPPRTSLDLDFVIMGRPLESLERFIGEDFEFIG